MELIAVGARGSAGKAPPIAGQCGLLCRVHAVTGERIGDIEDTMPYARALQCETWWYESQGIAMTAVGGSASRQPTGGDLWLVTLVVYVPAEICK